MLEAQARRTRRAASATIAITFATFLGAQPALAQVTIEALGCTPGNTLNITNAVAAGNAILVTTHIAGVAQTVSDGTNGYSTLASGFVNTRRTQVFGTFNSPALSAGTAITSSQVTNLEICAMEVHGLTTAPLDRTSTATGSSTNADSGQTAATTQERELLIGVVGDELGAGATITALGGFTEQYEGTYLQSQTLTASAIGNYRSTATLSAATNWSALVVTLKLACGNSSVGAGEQCDPGAEIATDCCSATCQFEPAATSCSSGGPACSVSDVCSGSSATCSAGTATADLDSDGACNADDADDDADGVADAADPDDSNPSVCGNADTGSCGGGPDNCDDCSVGTDGFGPLADNHPFNDGVDTDSDGLCDTDDTDDDSDGVPDSSDASSLDPWVCADADADSCDDCSVGSDGFLCSSDSSVAGDGTDTDGDGACDLGDPCPSDAVDDVDDDGYCSGTTFLSPKLGGDDNCPEVANADQEDLDEDGSGDACDPGDTESLVVRRLVVRIAKAERAGGRIEMKFRVDDSATGDALADNLLANTLTLGISDAGGMLDAEFPLTGCALIHDKYRCRSTDGLIKAWFTPRPAGGSAYRGHVLVRKQEQSTTGSVVPVGPIVVRLTQSIEPLDRIDPIGDVFPCRQTTDTLKCKSSE